MIVQTQPTGIQDGLQFTLQHADVRVIEKAEGVLLMLLAQVSTTALASSGAVGPGAKCVIFQKITTQKSNLWCERIACKSDA